jgi:bifunctional DNA-binding transcriptional regulator/antitoxin component of YhaV-PrlF toxin-antitoxin module
MPGYSGTPLPKKLGIKPGFRVQLTKAAADVRAELVPALAECRFLKSGEALDFGMIFTKSEAELTKEFSLMEKLLAPAGMIWVSWPKKTSGVTTDLNENLVREIGLDTGLVDVKVCAVTEIWSGLKFVRRLKDRKK